MTVLYCIIIISLFVYTLPHNDYKQNYSKIELANHSMKVAAQILVLCHLAIQLSNFISNSVSVRL